MKMRITIYVAHTDRNSDFQDVKMWFKKWGDVIYIEQYLLDDNQQTWDLEAPMNAIEELSKSWLCKSDWSNMEVIN